MVDYARIPAQMRGGIQRYIEEGKRPGHFLVALFSNDLMEAVAHADDHNLAALHDWMLFLYNEAPPGSYGSPENFKNWLESGGVNGRRQAAE